MPQEGIILSPCSLWIRYCQLIFFQKFPNFFWKWKLTSIRLFSHLAHFIESDKSCPLGGSKDEHFSCFNMTCQIDTGWTVNHSVFLCILPWNHALFFIVQYIKLGIICMYILNYEKRAWKYALKKHHWSSTLYIMQFSLKIFFLFLFTLYTF